MCPARVKSQLSDDSLVRQLYGAVSIAERHRHRYEVNNMLLKQIEAAGLRVAGRSGDDQLVVRSLRHRIIRGSWPVVSIRNLLTPRDGHPLFAGFAPKPPTSIRNASGEVERRCTSGAPLLSEVCI